MIDRIISIQNLGRFANHRAHGDITMRKLTLIYGENGRGKTTLSALFRSLMSGNTAPLLARKTLGQANQPAAEILIGGQVVRLQNGAWSAPLPDLAVFDSEFVHQNIYAGDHIARDHRRNSYRIIIGAQGVQLAQQVDQLDEGIRDANANLRRLREQVQRHIVGNTSIEDFLQIAAITDVDAQIQAKQTEIAVLARRIQQVVQIQAQRELQALVAPALPVGVAEILAKTIPDVARDAEARVRAHVQEHLDPQGDAWLAKGTAYARGQDCPFCGQDLENSDLIGLYRSYFNEAYRQLKQEVATLPALVTAAVGGNAIANLARGLAVNAERMGFWGQFLALTLPAVPTEALQAAFAAATTGIETAIHAKERSPLDAIPMPEDWANIEAQVHTAQQAIETYNHGVQAINAEIARLKQVQGDADINAAKAELQRLQQAKKRHEPAVVADCTALTNETIRKAQLEVLKVATRAQLDQYCQAVLPAYQDQINRYLDQFSTSFRITNTAHHYVGGTPSSQFQVEINNVAIDLGDDRTPENTPSFKTALSAGDRSALALAFFLTALRRAPNLAQRIVVLDDPFCSQDRFRRASTQYFIGGLAADAAQVIVLSHDPHFLKAVENDAQGVAVARLQTVAAGDAVSLTPCDLDAIIGCPLSIERVRLGAYVAEGRGVPIDVARGIRPVLEGYLRQAVPGGFNGLNMLGEMITAIRASAPGDPINRFAAFVDELDLINVYARAFHHPPGVHNPAPQIDGEELKGFARRTLRVVGGF